MHTDPIAEDPYTVKSVFSPPDKETLFMTIRYDWLRKQFIPAFLRGLRRDKVRYNLKTFNCRHYCRRFVMELVQELKHFGFTSKSNRPVVNLWVKQLKRFGGIAAEPNPDKPNHLHQVVKVLTDKDWVVVEPQTGRTVLFDKYPNRNNLKFAHL